MIAREELVNPTLEWLSAMSEEDFERTFNGSPVRRAGFAGLRRNVAVAIGNSGIKSLTPRLQEWTEAADTGVRAAARWALEKLNVVRTSTGNQ
jgi:epoxyqueuosine reductase